MTTTYASDLGKCYNKTEDGHFRLYKVDGMWAIYLVGKEILWDEMPENATELVYGTRLEAVLGGYISDPENFEMGVYELEVELRSLA